MKYKEKPIDQDNACAKSALRKSMSDTKTANPYDSDRHKAAREYLEKRKIKIRPLRSE